MLKKLVVGTAALAVAGGLILGSDALSYLRTFGGNVREAVKSEISVEFELDRIRDEVDSLMPEIRQHMTVVAEQSVDVKDLDKSPVADNEWFEFHLVVNGKRIVVNINGKPVVDYTEEDKPVRKKGREERILSHGPIALQAHDPESTTYFRKIQIKRLPD